MTQKSPEVLVEGAVNDRDLTWTWKGEQRLCTGVTHRPFPGRQGRDMSKRSGKVSEQTCQIPSGATAWAFMCVYVQFVMPVYYSSLLLSLRGRWMEAHNAEWFITSQGGVGIIQYREISQINIITPPEKNHRHSSKWEINGTRSGCHSTHKATRGKSQDAIISCLLSFPYLHWRCLLFWLLLSAFVYHLPL